MDPLFQYNIKNYTSLIKPVLKTALALIIFCTFPLLPLYTLCLLLLRQSVYLAAKILRPDLLSLVKSASVIFAQELISTKPKFNLVVVLAFDGPIELTEFRQVFQRRVIQKTKGNSTTTTTTTITKGELLYPELQQYWTSYLNYKFWKQDTNFDLKNHVRAYDYENGRKSLGCSNTYNEDFIRGEMGHLLAKPWKVNQSPWELLLVPNYKSKELNKQAPNSNLARLQSRGRGEGDGDGDDDDGAAGSLLVLRLHHALGDGYSILKLLLGSMMEIEPKIRINFPKVSTWDKILLGLTLPLRLPWDLAECVVDSIDLNNCWHQLWGNMSREYYTSISKPIEIQLVKRIKNKHGVSYSAVLSAAVAGASRRVMEEAGQEVPIGVTCATPTPLPSHPGGLVNHVSALFVKWPMDRWHTKKSRLEAISENMAASQLSTAPLGIRFGTKLTTLSPNCLSYIGGLVPSTLILSSFAGPSDPPKFLGVNYTDVFVGAGCGSGQVGATMMLVSANGMQRVVAAIDKSVFPSQVLFDNFGGYFEEELWALLQSQSQSGKAVNGSNIHGGNKMQ